MLQLYASWTFRHVAFQKPDSANYPAVDAFQKNIASAKNLVWCFLNCKIVTGHEIIDFFSKNNYSQHARAKRVFRIFALVRCHCSVISIDFNRKVLFYMNKNFLNTFELVKYIYDVNIKKRKVLRFFCGSVYFYHIMAWCPSWSCDPDAANKLSFTLPKETPHTIFGLISQAVSENFFENRNE